MPAVAHLPRSSSAVCAGDQFALFESIVTLAILLRRFEFSMAPDAPPVGMTTVTALAARQAAPVQWHLQ